MAIGKNSEGVIRQMKSFELADIIKRQTGGKNRVVGQIKEKRRKETTKKWNHKDEEWLNQHLERG